ncbi:MAG: [FeFe] hydrogenase, group A [Acetatifactor sp.]|nr:[FeFe] hydrogenase, group A [Acetatifactor sp.]
MVNLTIDNKPVSVEDGTTILEAARKVGINIPTLCFLKEINEIGACRICVVEVEGVERCVTACNTVVTEGMVIHTNSAKARVTRKTNVKLILSQHKTNCTTCVRSGNCTLQKVANDLNITKLGYENIPEEKAWDRNSPLIRDSSKCVKCMRCVQTCDKVQGMHVWDVVNTGSYTTVGVRDNKQFCDVNCTICGQCIVNCPVGALREHDDVTKVLLAVENPEIITVVQIAPAVRATWGEDFGLTKAFATEKRMVGALRNAGFDYIFDTTFSADLTIMEEGSELLQRLPEIKESGMPMFTSCCPGWVHFMRSEYPDMLPRLSSAKSPQGMFGAIAKTYFAEKLGVEPEKIFCVSIMPCTAKKKEITWKNSGDYVDAVLTTREMNRLIKTFFVNPEEIPEDDFDSPLGTGTGAGVIFGATGGVMEAALRSAYYLVTKENPDPDAFKDVRGLQGWKEASFDIAGTPVKVAVASGLVNTRKLVDAIRNKEVTYDFVEIMACPGGCVNGGGQPIHHDGPDVAERAGVLYGLDKKNNIRYSHENPEVIKLYQEFLGEPLSHKSHELLHIEHELE